jgi:DNA mismatch repair ATPase MutL
VDFASLGFDIKLQSENTIAVAGLPADVHTEQLDRAIYDLIQSLKLPQSVVELRRSTLAQTLAHSEAVGVVRFSQADAELVVKQILDSEECYTPMGKCIMTVYTVSDIKNTLE